MSFIRYQTLGTIQLSDTSSNMVSRGVEWRNSILRSSMNLTDLNLISYFLGLEVKQCYEGRGVCKRFLES